MNRGREGYQAMIDSPPLAEAFAAAFEESFEDFSQSDLACRAIAGNVTRSSLLKLGYAHGCKTGGSASGLVHRAELAHALGLPIESEWRELMDRVRELSKET